MLDKWECIKISEPQEFNDFVRNYVNNLFDENKIKCFKSSFTRALKIVNGQIRSSKKRHYSEEE
jgi:hypothetical protein